MSGEGAGMRRGLQYVFWSPWNQDIWLRESDAIFPFWTLFEPTPINWLMVFWNLFVIVNLVPMLDIKTHMYFRKASGLFCMCFSSLHPALSHVWQDSGYVWSPRVPLSPCRVASPAGPSFTQLHFSALLVTWNFLWPQLPLMVLAQLLTIPLDPI